MSSHVSFINSKQNISEKTPKASKSTSLSFSIKTPTKTTQLGTGFTPKEGTKRTVDYSTNKSIATNLTLTQIVNKMNQTLFIQNSNETVNSTFKKSTKYYNRFKMPTPNSALQKSFPHVFFVRPSCNILSGTNGSKLRSGLKANETFYYTWRNSPNAVKELVQNNGSGHDFMLSLSNAAASFSLSDEGITSDTYGKTYTGYKISYGKNNVESKTAGEFTITYNDDRNLNIYQTHRLWVEYINGVYRGEISPNNSSIINKILDYTAACYYILTAEDGETIIFWSKYYGVYPTNIPSGQFSWGAGNIVSNPQLDISYNYSFKEDYNPYSILEFNYNSRVEKSGGATYVPTYDPKLNHVGPTWVGVPFIELEKDSSTGTYQYKLRFRK